MRPRIVVAVRLPEQVDATMRAAGRLAAQVGGEVVLVYIAVELETAASLATSAGVDEDSIRAEMVAEIQGSMQALAERHFSGLPVHLRIREGDVATEIVATAAEMGADYLVVGTEGRGSLMQLIVGSTSHSVLTRAPCPVLVVPAPRR
jgi:nucleotide-binding universal stress UspA family protein